MPTVMTFTGLRVTIYPSDHRPAHVHVIGQGFEAVFRLNCPDGPVELRENYGFNKSVLSKILAELETNIASLCDKWSEIHGTY